METKTRKGRFQFICLGTGCIATIAILINTAFCIFVLHKAEYLYWLVPLLILVSWQVARSYFRILYSYVPAKSYIMNDGDKIERVFPEACWLKHWSACTAGGAYLRSYRSESAHLDFTTEDGRLICSIVLVRGETPAEERALNSLLRKADGKWKSFEKLARYMGYEFVHKVSNDWLEQFYNPLEIDQQEAYRQKLIDFVEGFVTEYSGDGISADLIGVGIGSHFTLVSQPHDYVLKR